MYAYSINLELRQKKKKIKYHIFLKPKTGNNPNKLFNSGGEGGQTSKYSIHIITFF